MGRDAKKERERKERIETGSKGRQKEKTTRHYDSQNNHFTI